MARATAATTSSTTAKRYGTKTPVTRAARKRFPNKARILPNFAASQNATH